MTGASPDSRSTSAGKPLMPAKGEVSMERADTSGCALPTAAAPPAPATFAPPFLALSSVMGTATSPMWTWGVVRLSTAHPATFFLRNRLVSAVRAEKGRMTDWKVDDSDVIMEAASNSPRSDPVSTAAHRQNMMPFRPSDEEMDCSVRAYTRR